MPQAKKNTVDSQEIIPVISFRNVDERTQSNE